MERFSVFWLAFRLVAGTGDYRRGCYILLGKSGRGGICVRRQVSLASGCRLMFFFLAV